MDEAAQQKPLRRPLPTALGLWDEEALPHSGLQQVTNAVPDLGGEFTLGSTDLRHRAVFNGIWQVGRGFQLSGLYYTGIGERAATVYGGDLRGLGGGAGGQALRRQRLRPMAPSARTTTPSRRGVASTCASSNGFPSVVWPSTVSRKCSTY